MATQFLVAEARRIYLGGLTNCSFLLPFRWKEEEEEEEENFLPTLLLGCQIYIGFVHIY